MGPDIRARQPTDIGKEIGKFFLCPQVIVVELSTEGFRIAFLTVLHLMAFNTFFVCLALTSPEVQKQRSGSFLQGTAQGGDLVLGSPSFKPGADLELVQERFQRIGLLEFARLHLSRVGLFLNKLPKSSSNLGGIFVRSSIFTAIDVGPFAVYAFQQTILVGASLNRSFPRI